MLQAPRIVRWTLPALLLTLVIGAALIVAASGREDTTLVRKGAGEVSKVSVPKKKAPKRIRVRRGDTAQAIARRADIPVVELLKLNPDVDPRALRAGQRLAIAP